MDDFLLTNRARMIYIRRAFLQMTVKRDLMWAFANYMTHKLLLDVAPRLAYYVRPVKFIASRAEYGARCGGIGEENWKKKKNDSGSLVW